ncbi:MAG: GNAT family N-acetyltransferase [Bacteroidota bacterium]
MIKYRNYKDEDFEEVLVLLNEGMDYDSLERFLLSEKLYDDPDWNPATSYIALNKNNIVGFLQGVKRNLNEKFYGYVKLFAVKEKYRRQGIGSELLRRFEKDMIAQDITSLRLFDVPLNYFMPGVDPRYTPAVCFFESKNYKKKGEAINMDVDLSYSGWDINKKQKALAKEGVVIERIDPDDKDQLMLYISDEWKLWEFEVKMAMQNDPPAVFIARKSGGIKAFAAWDGNNRGTGWFGPMGTHPSLRGKGLGSVLLYMCLDDMKKKGYEHSVIPWVGPVSFYSHYAGAKISRVFWRYEKELSDGK